MSEIELQDEIIKQALALQRLSSGEQREVEAILRALQRDLKKLLESRTLSGASKKQIKELIAEAGEVISARYAVAAKSVDTQALAVIIAEKTVTAIELAIPAVVTLPTAETLASLTRDVLIEGAPSSAWWKAQADDLGDATIGKFAREVRQGVINGETNEQIVSRIVGKRGVPGIMDTARRNARTLVHSSVQEAANTARLATFRKNKRLIKGVRQLSTLDGRTSPICIAYSDGEWDLDGNPLKGTTLPFNGGPPRHFNCRSILSAIPKTFRDIGLDVDEPKDVGKRASSLGPIRGDTTFEGFLKRQPTAFADKMLGKGRADLFRSGKITLRDLVSGTGRPLSLDELRNLN